MPNCLDSMDTIIYGDAFEKAPELYRSGRYDFVFADLWHDAADGPEMYLKLKNMEHLAPKAVFRYWIEDTYEKYKAIYAANKPLFDME